MGWYFLDGWMVGRPIIAPSPLTSRTSVPATNTLTGQLPWARPAQGDVNPTKTPRR